MVLLNVARHDSFASVVAGEYYVLYSPIITVLSLTQNMILVVVFFPYLNSLQNDPLSLYPYILKVLKSTQIPPPPLSLYRNQFLFEFLQ